MNITNDFSKNDSTNSTQQSDSSIQLSPIPTSHQTMTKTLQQSIPTSKKTTSITNKTWQYVAKNPQNITIDNAVELLLNNRNIFDEEVEEFLYPQITDYITNFLDLKDMEKAVSRTILAIQNKEKITIMGDYDVDGVSSSAILTRFFKYFNLQIEAFLPSRFDHGYGLSIDKIQENKDSLIIAVDCGAAANKELEFAASIGAEIIVLDHHKMPNIPQGAVAIVNPIRPDENEVLKEKFSPLCAAGVCFLFTMAMIKTLRNIGFFENKNEIMIKNFLDLVALATICDVVPLKKINRAFVKEGLKIIANSKNLGISILLGDVGQINAESVAFVVGPKLNAAGRLKSADLSLDLLTTTDVEHAKKIANILMDLNVQRQEIESNILCEALEQVNNQNNNEDNNKEHNEEYNEEKENNHQQNAKQNQPNNEQQNSKSKQANNKHQNSDKNFILVHSNTWHVGVIGIVAGRLKEIFHLPTFVITFDGNEIGTASCRSVDGIDLSKILPKIRHLLIKGGGHALAAGFTIAKSNLHEMEQILYKEIKQKFFAKINIDAYLKIEQISTNLHKQINLLEPFGQLNEKPKFVIKNVRIHSTKIIKDKHIQAHFTDDDENVVKTIAFNSVSMSLGNFLLSEYAVAVDIVCSLGESIWNGKKYTNVFLHDICVVD